MTMKVETVGDEYYRLTWCQLTQDDPEKRLIWCRLTRADLE